MGIESTVCCPVSIACCSAAICRQLGHKSGIAFFKSLTELFKLGDADLLVPRGLQSAPALLKLCSVGLGEVILRVALHVNHTELNVGLRKEAFGDRSSPEKSQDGFPSMSLLVRPVQKATEGTRAIQVFQDRKDARGTREIQASRVRKG